MQHQTTNQHIQMNRLLEFDNQANPSTVISHQIANQHKFLSKINK
jgi:hypothetical protein